MSTTFHIRTVCEEEGAVEGEPGYGQGWHYFRTTQTTINEAETDPDHPEATHRDFVVERREVIE